MTQDHAVVAGGSMAGLLAAAVLSETHERVTVVEPDPLPDGVGHRRGVPQSEHAHVLLARGVEVLEELLPGLRDELVAAGAALAPAVMGPDRGMRMVSPAGPLTDVEGDAPFLGVSRTLLEWAVRRRVLARRGVTVLAGHRAVGLAATPSGARVTGLDVRAVDDGRRGPHRTIAADLVVDATGRHSSVVRWLAALGYPSVPETVIETGVGYASRWYRRPEIPTDGWQGTIVNPRPGLNPRVGVLLPVENGLSAVSLGGVAGHHPPTDEAGFLTWAADLADPGLHRAIAEAEPLTEIRAYRTPTSRLRHFERLARWPAGLLVTGDAVCAFNPIYGQGMSICALEALLLRTVLREHPAAPEHAFRQGVPRVVAGAWSLASAEDNRWAAATSGDRRPWSARLRDRYVHAVQTTATSDPAVAASFVDVMLLLAPPASLTRPAVVGRVVRHHVRPPRRADAAGSGAARSGAPSAGVERR